MVLKLVKFLETKFNVSKPVFCILIILLVKLLYTVWFNRYTSDCILPGSFLANLKGDGKEYAIAAINIKVSGFYFPDVKPPGYSFVIYLALLFADTARALDLVVIFQLLLSSISVYILAKLAFLITRSHFFFLITFFIYGFTSYVTEYDRIILAESFTTSVLIFSIFNLYVGLSTQKKWNLLYAGIGIGIATYLRAAMLAFTIMLFALCFLAIIKNRKSFKSEAKQLLYLIMPLLLFLTLWGSRNYYYHKKIEPLMYVSGYNAPEQKTYYYDLHVFVCTWSGDMIYWNPTADINWFGCADRFQANDNIILPNYIYTSKYNYQSLVELRKKLRQYDILESDSLLKNEICGLLQSYSLSFKQENPVLYYFLPLRLAAKFIVNGGGTTSLFNKKFSDLALIEKLFKISMIFFYTIIAFLGVFIGIVISIRFLFKKNRSQTDLFKAQMAVFLIFSIFVMCFIFRTSEYRYFVPLFPICILLIFTSNYFVKLITLKRK